MELANLLHVSVAFYLKSCHPERVKRILFTDFLFLLIFLVFNTPKSYALSGPCAPGQLYDGKCHAVSTAFGEFSTEPGPFVVKVFLVLISVSGAIALILIMRAGYRIMTARGNQEGIQQGREQLVAAIVGLMFLVFSFIFLQVLTVDLLKIPTFR